MEVVENHYLYRHAVDDQNNLRHSDISLEETWVTHQWENRVCVFVLAITEVNVYLGFFNHYIIIPLAKKLKECKVFGVSCDEFMDFAEANLQEWELKGKQIVEDFAKKYNPTSGFEQIN